MIQGGDPNSKIGEETATGKADRIDLKAGFNDHRHDRGVISMARGPDPDSAGSQFSSASARCTGSIINTRPWQIDKGPYAEKIGDSPVTRNSMGQTEQTDQTRGDREASKIVRLIR